MKEEAIVHCITYGQQIIDGKIQGTMYWSDSLGFSLDLLSVQRMITSLFVYRICLRLKRAAQCN